MRTTKSYSCLSRRCTQSNTTMLKEVFTRPRLQALYNHDQNKNHGDIIQLRCTPPLLEVDALNALMDNLNELMMMEKTEKNCYVLQMNLRLDHVLLNRVDKPMEPRTPLELQPLPVVQRTPPTRHRSSPARRAASRREAREAAASDGSAYASVPKDENPCVEAAKQRATTAAAQNLFNSHKTNM